METVITNAVGMAVGLVAREKAKENGSDQFVYYVSGHLVGTTIAILIYDQLRK
jgi:precorrin isomerase